MSTTRIIPLAVDLSAMRADQGVVPAGADGAPQRTVGAAAITLVQGDTVIFRLFFHRAGANARLAATDSIVICGRNSAYLETKLYETLAVAGDVETDRGTGEGHLWAYDIAVNLHTAAIEDALAGLASVTALADFQTQSAGGAPTTWRIQTVILREVYAGGEPPEPADPP